MIDPFGGNLDLENRWVVISGLVPWQELDEEYIQTLSPTAGSPAKTVHLAFGVLYINQRLCMFDEETVRQFQENAIMQFFLVFSCYCSDAPFDPSIVASALTAVDVRRWPAAPIRK